MTNERNAIKQVTLQSLIYYHVLSRCSLEHRVADGCEWKACSELTSTQPPSPSLVTPRTPSSNLLEGQSGEEGQLVVRSGGAGRGAAPYEWTEVCSQTWERGKLCAQGEFLLTQKPHSLRQVYLRGRWPCWERSWGWIKPMTKCPTVRRGTSQSAGWGEQPGRCCVCALSHYRVCAMTATPHIPPRVREHQRFLTCP